MSREERLPFACRLVACALLAGFGDGIHGTRPPTAIPEIDDEVIVVFETARACVLFSPDGTPVRAKGSVGP